MVLLVLVLRDDRDETEARVQQQLAEANAVVARVQQQVAEANAVAATARQQVAELNAAMARTQQQVAEANAVAARARQQLAEANAVAARAQQERAARAPGDPEKTGLPSRIHEGVAVAEVALPRHVDDHDGDGVSNMADKCPTALGVLERFGCPRTESDRDGIEDALDACPSEPGDAAHQGCPIRDQDNDGIGEEDDSCPTEPGPLENRGCPLRDRDEDGIENDQDVCPDEPGLSERKGCPTEDADKDGVSNWVDTCVHEPGPENNLGCPEHEVPWVTIRPRQLELRGKVYFEASQARLQQRSFELLDWVARVLREHPEIPRVLVGAHTDDRGNEDQNRLLSQQRAEEVRRYLMDKGVAAQRLDARGYGSDRPIDSNSTAIGRENNRRVEFKIIRDSEAGSAAPE